MSQLQKIIKEELDEATALGTSWADKMAREYGASSRKEKERGRKRKKGDKEKVKEEVEEPTSFAPTAAEEAQKINDQTGLTYVTDQSYWESMGVKTGEDLARTVLFQTYSDTYKELYGHRPRGMPWKEMTPQEIQDAQAALDDEWMEHRHHDDQAWKDDDPEYIARAKEIEAEYEAEKEAAASAAEEERMKTPEQGEEFPKRAGMGKRMKETSTRRGTVKITTAKLDEIIKEETDSAIKEWENTRDYREGLYSGLGEPEHEMSDEGNNVFVTSGDTPPEREGYLEARIIDAVTLLKQGHSEEALEELMNALTTKL